MSTLETEITEKASEIAGKKLKKKDLMEWRTGKGIEKHDDETIYFIESTNIECAFKGKK